MTKSQYTPDTHVDDEIVADTSTLNEVASSEGGAEAVGELLWVDPRSLIVGVNIRGEAVLDRHFVRDIADRGVREPIAVRRAQDGALVVRKGKRRTLAAIEAGLERVRVFLEPAPDPAADDTAAQIERIVDQLGENAHRAANTDAEEVRAHQELLDLGLSAGQIARRTHTSTKRVRVTTTVARSELAAAVLARYDLTLDQVAVIAEFDDGTEVGVEAVKVLTVTAQKEPGQFAHVAQRLRDQREDQQLHAARGAELTAARVRILDPSTADGPDGGPSGAGGAVMLSNLRPTADSPNGTALSEDAHAECAGHAASVEVIRGWRGGPSVSTTWWCTDPDTHGHAPRWDRPTTTAGTGASGVGERQPGPMTEEEKAERRRVIGNNKDWDSATTVRKEWLTGFLARKSAPKDAARYIAATLAHGGHDVRRSMENSHPTACELLGLDAPAGFSSGRPHSIGILVEAAAPPRLTVLALAVLLGAAEDGTSRNSWRNPTTDTRAYFTALASWGYPLSPVEQLVCNPAGPAVGTQAEALPTASTSTGEVDVTEDSEPSVVDGDETVNEVNAEVVEEAVTDAA